MSIAVEVTGTKEEIERKVRILKACIRNAKAKKDDRSLKGFNLKLQAHEEQLRGMK